VAANAEIAKAQRELRVKQIGVAGAAADAQARQFELDQKFNQDSRYVQQLAGNYQNYAAGQALMGAGQGMAAHGMGDGLAGAGAGMAVGVGMGNMMAGAFGGGAGGSAAQQPAPQPQFSPGGTQVTCPKCQVKQAGGKFCSDCGATLATQKKFCTGCGGELSANAKFCANCGTSATAQ
jgi:hypothetical protein